MRPKMKKVVMLGLTMITVAGIGGTVYAATAENASKDQVKTVTSQTSSRATTGEKNEQGDLILQADILDEDNAESSSETKQFSIAEGTDNVRAAEGEAYNTAGEDE